MGKTRKTRQGALIDKAISDLNTFFSAVQLHGIIKKKDRSIGLATVYRHLADQKKKGLLFSYRCGRRSIFSKEKKSHCHFICEKTGKVIHFEIGSLDFLKDKIPGSISSFQIEVRGVCSDCRFRG